MTAGFLTFYQKALDVTLPSSELSRVLPCTPWIRGEGLTAPAVAIALLLPGHEHRSMTQRLHAGEKLQTGLYDKISDRHM